MAKSGNLTQISSAWGAFFRREAKQGELQFINGLLDVFQTETR